MTKKKTIFHCFAGRKQYMEIQLHYMIKILNKYEFVSHYDIWNFAWTPEDRAWIRTLDTLHPKIRVRNAPDFGDAKRANNVASKQFAYFFTKAYPVGQYYDYLFVKIDDDVVYIDVEKFDEFIDIRIDNPHAFLISADVINNNLSIKNPTNLHMEFISNIKDITLKDLEVIKHPTENRLSINFVSWLGSDLESIEIEFGNGVGSDDEWRLCNTIPIKLNRKNLITKNFHCAHFSFGSQVNTKEFNQSELLMFYRTLLVQH